MRGYETKKVLPPVETRSDLSHGAIRAELGRILTHSESQATDKMRDSLGFAVDETPAGRLLAIPHNGNLSCGLMFDDITLTTKKPLDRDYAERRMHWEPLYEVTQIKGDGEAHPALSTNDEFADFERSTAATTCRASCV